MNDLMVLKRVSSFTKLLDAYNQAGINLGSVIDGGAGSGSTAKTILNYLEDESVVYAFEPFIGNHRFFENIDPRIKLIKKALAESEKEMSFRVSSVVEEDSTWGRKGMTGYSSVGALVEKPKKGNYTVECVRADSIIEERIGFIKLDLQGGEANALRGMKSILPCTALMWVEYLGIDKTLLDLIIDEGFIVFDTELFFLGQVNKKAKDLFEVSRENFPLSTGELAWFGYKKKPWENFKEEFSRYKRKYGLVQTDLVCINRNYIDEFLSAVRFL